MPAAWRAITAWKSQSAARSFWCATPRGPPLHSTSTEINGGDFLRIYAPRSGPSRRALNCPDGGHPPPRASQPFPSGNWLRSPRRRPARHGRTKFAVHHPQETEFRPPRRRQAPSSVCDPVHSRDFTVCHRARIGSHGLVGQITALPSMKPCCQDRTRVIEQSFVNVFGRDSGPQH